MTRGRKQSNSAPQNCGATPLVVDVDGTLLRTDLLHEGTLALLGRHPALAFRLPAWLLGGKSALKARIADLTEIDCTTLPKHEEVLSLITRARAEGRPVYLASASNERHVAALAESLGGIDGIFASTSAVNLSGDMKARMLVEAFGRGGFDYVGNGRVDFPVWAGARRVFAMASSANFERRVAARFPDAEFVRPPRRPLAAYWHALRPHQWSKNLLVFLPLLVGHRFAPEVLATALVAFACFCAAASSAYIVNDLLDLAADRQHPSKQNRPFAAGVLPVSHGVAMSVVLMAGALVASWLVSPDFCLLVMTYVAGTLAYSLVLKRKALVDVVVLAGLFTIRVVGGGEATGVELSNWLLMFSMFLFLSLAVAKRCSEVVAAPVSARVKIGRRGYRTGDLPLLLSLGAAAGYASVLVIALYIASPEVNLLYRHADRLWLATPILIYWVSRILLLANRGDLDDDPIIFAFFDRITWIAVACVAGIIAFSI